MILRLLTVLIRFYQYFISPLSRGSCKYYPVCSEYALTALMRHGIIKGLGLSLWRILRCNPWNRSCGYDPVPPAPPNLRHPNPVNPNSAHPNLRAPNPAPPNLRHPNPAAPNLRHPNQVHPIDMNMDKNRYDG